jgi:hypothetical protein
MSKQMNDQLALKSDAMTAGFNQPIFHMMNQILIEDNLRSRLIQRGL